MVMANIERFTRKGRKLEGHQDKPFMGQEGLWGAYEQGYSHYMEDLAPLEYYPDEILNTLHSAEKPVVVDVMSSTGMLQDLVVRYLKYKRGKYIAVGRFDNRMEFREGRDTALGITMVEGNVKDLSTWQELKTTLGDDEADFVIARPLAGLYFVPTKANVGYKIFNEAYGLLKDGGSLIAQIPPITALDALGIPMDNWLAQLNELGVPYRHVPQYASATDTKGKTYGLLRIDRIPGIPELPMLNGGQNSPNLSI